MGPFVAANFGPTGSGLTSAGMMLVAVLVLARWVKEAPLPGPVSPGDGG